ncbi:MAG: ATP phosphoribosyltransferase, partial [Planctomycetes bacterium]|nr:ATP phosphoribosyltransferase [Planctomycetota bacterium]
SVTVVAANREALADSWKKAKIEAMVMMLKGALSAKEKVLLKLNAPRRNLADILKILPSLTAPTVNALSDETWTAVETIVDASVSRTLIPELKRLGAEGILELTVNSIIP